jgi:lysophospholipid acyltransferase (LPLAT)-like uncharacterized protein
MERQSLKDRIVFFLATKLGWLLILVLGKLTKIEYVGREHYLRLKKSGRPFVICIWHGRMLLPVYLLRDENIYGLVSEHKDGEMIAQTVKKLGWKTVRGSSTRSGRKAALGLIKALRSGNIGCIIPDGPRGPRHEFKDGTLFIAQKTGAAIVALTFSSDRFYEFASWDRFRIWKPMSRSVVIFSKPVEVPEELTDAEFEKLRQQIQELMIEQQNTADAYFRK